MTPKLNRIEIDYHCIYMSKENNITNYDFSQGPHHFSIQSTKVPRQQEFIRTRHRATLTATAGLSSIWLRRFWTGFALVFNFLNWFWADYFICFICWNFWFGWFGWLGRFWIRKNKNKSKKFIFKKVRKNSKKFKKMSKSSLQINK